MKHTNILTQIVEDKKQWLNQRLTTTPLHSFKDKVKPSQRNFYHALQQKKEQNTCAFILECKKASPSKGLIREDFDPRVIASTYRPYAAAISVLTDEKYFQGSFDYLNTVSQSVYQPVLCKDFIINEYQIYLARYHQADAILLMLSILSDEEYQHLSQVAHKLNMGVLTEAISEDEIARAINMGAKVIGINNRDLRDLSIQLNRTKQLAPLIPKDTVIISESGIYTHQHIKELRPHVHGYLIGSALMSQKNLDLAIRQVLLGSNKVCGLTRLDDATVVYEAGAVYGGLIFAPHSARCITPEKALAIVRSVPLQWVGVFVNEPIEHVVNISKQLQLTAVQLHGQEDATYIQTLKQQLDTCNLATQIWKALRVENDVPEMSNPLIDYYVLDHGSGGTGARFDWGLLEGVSLSNVLVAGGINSSNIQQALTLNAYGLDLNSGVETSPGIKDKAKISELFAAIRSY